MEACECGVASLSMILGYYERYVPLEKLRLDCGVSRDGSNAANLLEAAKKYGLDPTGLRKPMDELLELDFPAIILWGPAHYVVLEGFGKTLVYLNDPAKGKRSVSYKEFEKIYRGIVLIFKKNPAFKAGGIKPLSLPQRIAQYLKEIPSSFTFLLLTSACLLIPGFAFPAFLLVFIDTYFSKFHIPWKGGFLLLVLIAALFSGALVWAQLYFLNRLNTKLSVRFSSNFLWRLLKLPINYFENRSVGQISQYMSFNQLVAEILTGSVIFILVHLLFFFFFAFAMFAYDRSIAWVGLTVGMINLSTIVLLYFLKSDTLSLAQINQTLNMEVSIFGISNIDSIKIKGGESEFFSIWSGIHTKSLNQNQKLEKKNLILSVLPHFFQMLAWTALLGIGSLQIIEGNLSAGKLMALGFLQISFLIPINHLAELSPLILSLKKASQRLDEVAQTQVDLIYQSSPKKVEKIKLNGSLEFRNVTFQYTPLLPPILKEFNFTIQPGQRFAILGRNGSGKSTLAKLAAGVYHPTSGQIFYDGIPIEKISPELFRNSIAYIEQEIFLFAGNVRENITLWNGDVSDPLIYEAAQEAGMHEKISLRAGGYDSTVSQGGNNFSIGDKQQLQMARGFLYHPSFLILDKAMSNLDTETELFIMDRIKTRKISSLIIEDRIQSIRDCHQILVLDGKGNIAQRGSHQELQNIDGIYQQLLKSESQHG